MDMAMVNRFLEKDIPYGKLANLGIDREKTLSMPTISSPWQKLLV